MQLRDCQFQMRTVWSSEQLIIHGDSCKNLMKGRLTDTDLVEEGGADVVKMAEQREQAPALLVVPHLGS